MNPEGVPPKGYPAQPGGPEVIQSITVNIVTDPPKDHIIWSLFMFVYFNPCCLGLASLIHSIKSRDRRMVGDLEGARHHATTALRVNMVSTVLAVVTCVLFIIAFSSVRASE